MSKGLPTSLCAFPLSQNLGFSWYPGIRQLERMMRGMAPEGPERGPPRVGEEKLGYITIKM